ncbi:DUF4150 domain-containing protein [Herbaspirillum rubrisubalbicans]|uniref:DUF4150 domain-containing protein n=1 Tax=Herbaspirillum rubrisubalbicans TaxID=80842 RepID=A0AAD0UBH9_9BURK|nr:DUF4150 domain-containing protein [Herbaspirillum rubrisubalbicans]ALU89502.1 hypothetical protein Hrubri_2317 [Herbaspirillum rubrisubalbicans M1]AYR24580.1 DUF4150 domain-containing protein [Herbaspirillum rubrisubalbicans]
MFANTSLGVMNMAAPDVCKTPPLAEPLPYPNIALSTTHIPTVPNVIICGGFAENLLTPGTISNGDEPGVMGGVVSQVFIGPDASTLGSFKVMMGEAFASHLTGLTAQNGKVANAVGATLVPAQTCVVILS